MKIIFIMILFFLFSTSQIVCFQSMTEAVEKPSKREIKQARVELQRLKSRLEILQERVARIRGDDIALLEQLEKKMEERRKKVKEAPVIEYEQMLDELNKNMTRAISIRLRQILLDNFELDLIGMTESIQSAGRISKNYPSKFPAVVKHLESKITELNRRFNRIEQEELVQPLYPAIPGHNNKKIADAGRRYTASTFV